MDVAQLRHQVISQNLANVNTPGYRQREVSFDDAERGLENTVLNDVHFVLVVSKLDRELDPGPANLLTEQDPAAKSALGCLVGDVSLKRRGSQRMFGVVDE